MGITLVKAKKMDDKHAQAYLMFLEGKSYREIGLALSCHAQTAARWVKDYRDDLTKMSLETARDEQAIELDRLNTYTKILEDTLRHHCEDAIDPETGKLYRDGVRSKVAVIQTLLRVSDQRVKLRGLHKVIQVQMTEAVELSQMDIADMEQADVINLITSYVREDKD